MSSELSPGMIRLVALGIGALMLVTITIFHGVGLHHVVRHYKRGEERILAHRPHKYRVALLFGMAVFWMLSLHLVEIFYWAFSLWRLGLVQSLGDSFYFSANSYTTLGYGKVPVAEEWRAICPVIAISGLFTFAWTASTLVNVVASNQKLHDQIAGELEKEKELRAEERAETRALREKGKVQEQVVRAKERQEAAGKSFLQRRELKKEMRSEIDQLRAAEEAQAKELRKTEHDAETRLGEPLDSEDSKKES
jgi:hypothetical protein